MSCGLKVKARLTAWPAAYASTAVASKEF